MNKKWQYVDIDKENAKRIAEKFGINEITAGIIANKHLTDEQIQIFLEPTRNNFYDPFLLPDMEKAVKRIVIAIEKKEKTVIFGDYDVDGITSTTVLKKFLEERGLEVRNIYTKQTKTGIWTKQRSDKRDSR